jgi:hypothetical protein
MIREIEINVEYKKKGSESANGKRDGPQTT